MKSDDKRTIEDFAKERLGVNHSVAVQTSTLKAAGFDVDLLCGLIGDYNALPAEERNYIFEKEGIAVLDPTRFAIVVRRR